MFNKQTILNYTISIVISGVVMSGLFFTIKTMIQDHNTLVQITNFINGQIDLMNKQAQIQKPIVSE